MISYVLKKIAYIIPVIILVTFIATLLVTLVPGDPAAKVAGEFATPAQIAAVRVQLGLNQPFFVRYWHFVSNLFEGKFGTSVSYEPGASVAHLIGQDALVTFSIVLVTMVFTVILGMSTGIVAALYKGSRIDRATTVFVTFALAIPPFVLGPVLITFLAINHNIFPALGYTSFTHSPYQWFLHLVLPAFALSLNPAAQLSRQVRASLVGELDESYIRAAYGKGLRTRRVVGKHAMKNASIAAVTVLGLAVAGIVGGTVIVEVIFALPGLGQLAYASVVKPDYPIIQVLVVLTALFVLITNFTVDMLYLYFDPKLRESVRR
jgi:peptide/nickel transport system permease protein